jgi:hypothetical protein
LFPIEDVQNILHKQPIAKAEAAGETPWMGKTKINIPLSSGVEFHKVEEDRVEIMTQITTKRIRGSHMHLGFFLKHCRVSDRIWVMLEFVFPAFTSLVMMKAVRSSSVRL